jgi:hypothetical protein
MSATCFDPEDSSSGRRLYIQLRYRVFYIPCSTYNTVWPDACKTYYTITVHTTVFLKMWPDISVGIATRYGLDGPGIESRWEARDSAPVQTSPGANTASYTMGTGSFPGVKRPGRGVDHPPPSSAEVQERVELYLYSHSGPPWPVLGRILPLPLPSWRWTLWFETCRRHQQLKY